MTLVIVSEAVRKFPVQAQSLEMCRYVISKLTPHFREALTNNVLRQDQGLSQMHDLLRNVLIHNCDGVWQRNEIQMAVLTSDEGLTLAKEMARRIDNDELVPLFRWENIDNGLVRLRLTNLAEEIHDHIKQDERRIKFENRGNLNGHAVQSLVLKMKEQSADGWAQKAYEIYCDVWGKQGFVRCGAFVRAVCARAIVPGIRARKNAIASEFSRSAISRSLAAAARDAMMKSFQMNMQRLEDRWQRRLEIEAKECEHANKMARLSMQPSAGTAAMKTSIFGAEENRHSPSEESRRTISVSGSRLNRKQSGRKPKLSQAFIALVGKPWQDAMLDSHTRVSDDRLRQIAFAADEAGHLPPGSYLEPKYAREVRAFNSRNSNSKTGPVKTWLQLISLGQKDFMRGTRRLFSRCAKKLEQDHLSGN